MRLIDELVEVIGVMAFSNEFEELVRVCGGEDGFDA